MVHSLLKFRTKGAKAKVLGRTVIPVSLNFGPNKKGGEYGQKILISNVWLQVISQTS